MLIAETRKLSFLFISHLMLRQGLSCHQSFDAAASTFISLYNGVGRPQQSGKTPVCVLQVYDVVLDAALKAQKCGPRQLQVQDEWEWLLSEFAGQPSAQQAYAVKAPC